MHSTWITTLGLLAGSCTGLSFIPQVVKIWKSKHVKDISLLMYLIFSSGVLLWLLYGVFLDDLPIIITNSFTLVLCLCVLVMKFKFKNN